MRPAPVPTGSQTTLPVAACLPTLAAMLLKLTSLLGLFAFIAIAWALSTDRKKFPWRTVISGVLLQFVFGLLILNTFFFPKSDARDFISKVEPPADDFK